MIEYLSKRKFINALAREAVNHAERTSSMDRPPAGLSLEFMHPNKDSSVKTLVIRGNQTPQHWMILESGFPSGKNGYVVAHRGAIDIAIAASQSASIKTGKRINIGMPEVEFDIEWNVEEPK
jgi:hypothetical protein